MLQEAAKGMYRRSEKWNLGQALRGAVQGLQAGGQPSRRPLSNVRWSFDEGRETRNNSEELSQRIQALEERNKALGKMIQAAMEDLSDQARQFDKEKAESAANAITLTIAKLQFVQVYLDNSTLPLGAEHSASENKDKDNLKQPSEPNREISSTASSAKIVPLSPDRGSPTAAGSSTPKMPSVRSGNVPIRPSAVSASPSRRKSRSPPKRTPTIVVNTSTSTPSPDTSLQSPFQQPRPSLASSSFSWMLGDNDSKSGFVSASPFPPEEDRKENAVRGRTGFLFGEEKRNGSQGSGAKGKGREKRKDEGDGDDDGFTLGTLKGVGR